MNKPREEFLDLATACGARLTGKPNGTEPIEVVFPVSAWRDFDAKNKEAAQDAARYQEMLKEDYKAASFHWRHQGHVALTFEEYRAKRNDHYDKKRN